MLLIKTTLNSAPLTFLENESESVWSKVSLNGKDHYFGSWYREPSSPVEHMNLLREQFLKIKEKVKSYIIPNIHILGDLNFRKIDWEKKINKETGSSLSDCDGQILIDILNENSAEQVIMFPTRENNTLDLFITTTPDQIKNIDSPDKFSDHDVIMGTFTNFKPYKKQQKRTFLVYSKGDYITMRDEMSNFSNDKYFNGYQNDRCVEKNWNLFKTAVLESIKKSIPSKRSKGVKSVPWISNKIKSLIKKRNRVHSSFKKTGNTRLKNKWQKIRLSVQKEVKIAHDSYVNNLIGDIKSDSKPFWKYINSKKSEKSGIPPLKTEDGRTVESDIDKANALNKQFTSVYTITEYSSVPVSFKDGNVKMENIIMTSKGVEKLLIGLNVNKAMGPDSLHPRVLKELGPSIADILAHLFQQSINVGDT
ncbi:uncharacterized protein LOC128553373 [Mercenaria mercenaria]|uniref:uncharacterized protein LOC128553373 n=1 Tax=Mercenaria mercenaria TaxID=6596 RepID=UPI00234EC2CC|nr:uncharacterized protein LOC128553373 [Mercenaria mercenaria]